MSWGTVIGILHYGIALAVAVRVMLKPGMAASVRLAWILVIELLPVVGILAWVLFGEVRMRRVDRQRAADVRQAIAERWVQSPYIVTDLPEPASAVMAQASTTGGLRAVRGNRLRLLPEGDEAMAEVARAIDAARHSVDVLYYIWLDDVSGRAVARACAEAARRGVLVRVIADAMGSRRFLRSQTWADMLAAGVEGVQAFPLGNPFARALTSRLDLRNHRKIVVVDGTLGFTGSRNCSDMAFAAKPKYAPWVDVLIAVEGPAVRQLEVVFVQDWLTASIHPVSHEALTRGRGPRGARLAPAVLHQPPPPPLPQRPQPLPAVAMATPWGRIDAPSPDLRARAETIAPLLPPIGAVAEPGQIVQVVPTGPDFRPGTLSDVLTTLMHAARQRLTITTPYYVPDEATDAAICAAARRGVEVTMILPARNDSPLVQAVSEGFYGGLLRAGVRIALFQEGLCHSKIVSVDSHLALVGTANLDRRSFDLNYEVSLMVADRAFVTALDERQADYLRRSRWLTLEEVRARPALWRMTGNVAALAAPLL